MVAGVAETLRSASVMGRPRMVVTKERLLSRRQIDSVSGCWIWMGTCDSYGYGLLTIKVGGVPNSFGHTARVKVHRLAADLWSVPGEGPHVCHSCDRSPCFNPEHLFRGTQRDNLRDASRKGRLTGGRGTPRPHYALRRLSAEAAEEVRHTYEPRDPHCGMRALARRFGVTPVAILQILREQTYKKETLSFSSKR